MSIREEAIDIIGSLTDDGVKATIDFMSSYMARRREEKSPSLSKKRQAFLRMQKLRKEMAQIDFSDNGRTEALTEKYGAF